MIQKIVFLDIDGPMIPQRAYYLKENRGAVGTRFDPIATGMLLDILETTGARIVVSATVGNQGQEYVISLLEKNGIDKGYLHPDGVTPRDIYRKRQDQIQAWLSQHPEVNKYAVLDDEDMKEIFDFHMVAVSFEDGFLTCHYAYLEKILSKA